ncbi:MAG: cytochrome c [Deinococcaceae bacterium]
MNRSTQYFFAFVGVGLLGLGVYGSYRLGHQAALVRQNVGSIKATPSGQAPAVDGQGVFASSCSGCHGSQAEGAVGPKLAGNVKAWSLEVFEQAVLNGKSTKGGDLQPMMPRFKTMGVGDAEINAVYTYLKTL